MRDDDLTPSCIQRSASPFHLEPDAFAGFQHLLAEHLGLLLVPQTDLAGRTADYGFHWHMPNAQGDCMNLVCFGYITPLDPWQPAFSPALRPA